MIDNDKLKYAHELCAHHGNFYLTVSLYPRMEFSLSLCPDNEIGFEINFDNIDDLIAKLEELTKPEPKYKVGDTVWRNCFYKVYDFVISELSINDDNEWECDNVPESELYASRAELIQSQIEYWVDMASEENNKIPSQKKVRDYVDSLTKCHHSPDTSMTELGNEQFKCKKCGDFYR